MSEISAAARAGILAEIRLVFHDAEYSAKDSYSGKISILFQDTCGCYSEWTTDPCCLEVYVRATVPTADEEAWEYRMRAESYVREYVTRNFTWSGCECCENRLLVFVKVFPKEN